MNFSREVSEKSNVLSKFSCEISLKIDIVFFHTCPLLGGMMLCVFHFSLTVAGNKRRIQRRVGYHFRSQTEWMPSLFCMLCGVNLIL